MVERDPRPGRIEGAGILDREARLKRLAAFDHLEALDDVQLRRVRRPVIVKG